MSKKKLNNMGCKNCTAANEVSEIYRQKLKDCRNIMREHGLGDKYPGVSATYESNMNKSVSISGEYWRLQSAHNHLLSERGIEIKIYKRVIKVVGIFRKIKYFLKHPILSFKQIRINE